MALLDEVRAANDAYAAEFTKGDLPMPPGRKFAVVACMDARLDPPRRLAWKKAMPTSFATRAAARPMRCAHS